MGYALMPIVAAPVSPDNRSAYLIMLESVVDALGYVEMYVPTFFATSFLI